MRPATDKAEIGRQSSSYRQGVVLGLTMAEVMLLLVFCLLIALAAILSKMGQEKSRLEEKLRQASAVESYSKNISKLLSENPRLREAIEHKYGSTDTAEISEFWRKLVENNAAVENLERLGVSRTEIIETASYIAEAEKLRKSNVSLAEAKRNAALMQAIASKFPNSIDATDAQIVSAVERGLANPLSDDGHHWPPIIKLSESDGYYFDSGKADLAPEFLKSLRTIVPNEIVKIAKIYDVDVIEVVGHTDEQPIGVRTSNLDKELINSLTTDGNISRLQAADNAGLGLARAAAVVNVFLSDKRLSKYKILPLSGAQLIQNDESLASALTSGNVKERRRIEIRLRKSTPTQVLGQFVSQNLIPVGYNQPAAAPIPVLSLPKGPQSRKVISARQGSALAADFPLNPDVTQATIAATICQTGWTQTVRPYVADMKRIKAEMLAAIGEPIERRNQYELDHLVPLALGGAVIDRRNLALQPIDEAREKDAIEVCLSSLVCQGRIDLEDAQGAIWEDWRKAGELCGGL